jgi:hypothetical protein
MLDIEEFPSALLLKTSTAGTHSSYMRSAGAFIGPPVVGARFISILGSLERERASRRSLVNEGLNTAMCSSNCCM